MNSLSSPHHGAAIKQGPLSTDRLRVPFAMTARSLCVHLAWGPDEQRETSCSRTVVTVDVANEPQAGPEYFNGDRLRRRLGLARR